MYAADKRTGQSKEGSGRVALHHATGVVHWYVSLCEEKGLLYYNVCVQYILYNVSIHNTGKHIHVQLQVLNFIQLLMSTLLINSLHYLVPSTRGSILITIEYHKLDQECTCISVHNRVGGGDNKS